MVPVLGAVSSYLGSTSDYAGKGYSHIVNEPQTFSDYDIVAYLAQQTKAAAPNVRLMVSEQVEASIYNNATYPGGNIDIWLPTISNYEPEKSHDRQANHGEEVWWYFLYGDRPPLPNPSVMDRAGLEACITPWLAWLERVDGLLYYATTDWSPDPWTQPWSNNSSNGDAIFFYPPKDGTLAFDACDPQSNRLVPSLRWELLREITSTCGCSTAARRRLGPQPRPMRWPGSSSSPAPSSAGCRLICTPPAPPSPRN